MGKAVLLAMGTLFMLALTAYVYQNYEPGLDCREEFVRTGSVTGSIVNKQTATENLNKYIEENFMVEYRATNPEWQEIKYYDPVWGMRFSTTAYVSYKFAVDEAGNVYAFRSCP